MRFTKGVTKALEKGNKDPLNANKAEVPILSLIPEEGEYDEDQREAAEHPRILQGAGDQRAGHPGGDTGRGAGGGAPGGAPGRGRVRLPPAEAPVRHRRLHGPA